MHALHLARPASLTVAALLCALALMQPVVASAVEVRELSNLQHDAARAEREQIPILVALFASWCEWCERVEQEFLRPMLISGDYRHTVIIRKLETDGHQPFIGIDGQPEQPEQFARHYHAGLTPTLIFIDHHGNEIAARMVGLTTPEMYAGYIDQAIEQASDRYRHGNNTNEPR